MSQMDAVSPEFVTALMGSFEYRVTVDVWAGGQLVKAGLDVNEGSLTVTNGQSVRSRVTLTVPDPDGLIRPTGDDSTISPYGPELNIKAGLRLGRRTELVSLGWYTIVNVDVTQSWRTYKSADDVILLPSGSVDIEAVDRAQRVKESKFVTQQQPKESTVLAECARIVRPAAPWLPPDLDDASIPSTVTYSRDRMQALTDLANVIDAYPVADPSGAITLQSRTWGDPVWTIAGGDDGVLVNWQRSLSRDEIHNAAIVTGFDPQYGLAPRVGRAYQQDGPLRWRHELRIPYLQDSPLLTTQDQVDRAAQSALDREISQRRQQVKVECSPNPALDAGDVVTLQAPRGTVPVRISSLTLPLVPGRMQLSCEADPVLLGQVA